MTDEERAVIEAKIREDLTIRLDEPQSRVCPDPVNLLYDDIEWFFVNRRDTPPSDFMRIHRVAQLHGWIIEYLDYGIGHDAHMMIHHQRQLAMLVSYRSAHATRAALNDEDLPLEQVLTTLTGP